jgi:hypothetical protein
MVAPTGTDEAHTRASRADIVGMVLGGAIPVIAVALGSATDPPIEMLTVAGVVGIPLGIVFGSVYGIEAREADGKTAFDLALRMAVLAVLVGDLVIGAVVTIALSLGGLSGVVFGVVATVTGLLVLGLPALAFAIVCTLVWAASLRALPRRLVGDEQVEPA